MHIPINRLATIAAVALALPVAVMAPAAQAVLITEWGYSVENGFDSWTDDGETGGTGIVGVNPNPDLGNRPTKLQWSDDGGDTSSISITPDVSGPPPQLFTNGAAVAGADFIHDNFTIDGDSASLSTATILSQLILTPLAPPGSPLSPVSILFGVDFTETDNASVLSNCPGDSVSLCDDIFVLTNPSGELSSSFVLDGYKYTVLIDILGLKDPLNADACAAAGSPAGCRGILTQENTQNIFGTEFRIIATEVPGPGTLSLLALGLLCLLIGGVSRHRRAG